MDGLRAQGDCGGVAGWWGESLVGICECCSVGIVPREEEGGGHELSSTCCGEVIES